MRTHAWLYACVYVYVGGPTSLWWIIPFVTLRLNHPVKRFKPSETRSTDSLRQTPYNRRSSPSDLYSYHLQQQIVASPPNNLNQPFIKQEIKQEPSCNIPVSYIICAFFFFIFSIHTCVHTAHTFTE